MSFVAAIPLIGKVFDRIFPDPAAAEGAKLKLLELSQQGDLAELDSETKIMLGQMAINQEEAKSGSIFVAGWRPAVGWICALAVAYNFVLHPMIMWGAAFADMDIKDMPSLDISQLMVLLFGMLGIGGMRSFDKIRGVGTRSTGNGGTNS